MRYSLILVSCLLAACSATSRYPGQPVPEPAPILVEAESTTIPDYVSSSAFEYLPETPLEDYAGFGILAFPSSPDPARFMLFCESLLERSPTVDEVTATHATDLQMLTAIPLRNPEAAASLNRPGDYKNRCNDALSLYDIHGSQILIKAAQRAKERTDGVTATALLNGNGPFLLAWSPPETIDHPDTIVLVADLSQSSSREQIRQDIRFWSNDIVKGPSGWRKGRWNIENLRRMGARWIDGHSLAIVALLGAFAE